MQRRRRLKFRSALRCDRAGSVSPTALAPDHISMMELAEKISSMFHVELKYQIALDRLPMTHANRKHLVLCLLCERRRSLHENFAISEKKSVALNQQQQRLPVYSTPTAKSGLDYKLIN